MIASIFFVGRGNFPERVGEAGCGEDLDFIGMELRGCHKGKKNDTSSQDFSEWFHNRSTADGGHDALRLPIVAKGVFGWFFDQCLIEKRV